MKPVSEEKLHTVLDKAAANLAKAEKRMCVMFDRQTDYIPLSKITYIEAQKQYVNIYTEGETYRMKSSLADVEQQLDEYFFKCQRSFIVNLRHVKRIKGRRIRSSILPLPMPQGRKRSAAAVCSAPQRAQITASGLPEWKAL